MNVSTHQQIAEALTGVIGAALARIPGAPDVEYAETRLAERVADDDENRFRVILMPQGRRRSDQQLVSPPPYQVIARYQLGLDGVGPDDAAREALLEAMARAIDAELISNFTLGGAAVYAQAMSLESDIDKVEGVSPETLLDLAIEVEFDCLTRLG